MVMRGLKSLVLLSGIMLFFAGCGSKESATQGGGTESNSATTGTSESASAGSEGGKIHLDFWHYFGGEHIKAMQDLISAFEKENPNIEINPVFQGRAQELSQKLNSSFATTPANNPVLSTVYESWTDDFVSRGYMDAVQDHFDGPDPLSKQEQDDFVKVFREANTWNGKWITMPFNKSIYVTYMNLDRLAKAGYTTAPKNLAELKDAIIKMTDTESARKSYGYGLSPASEAFTTLFYASGGQYLDDNGNVAFAGPEGQAVVAFLRELQFPKKNLYVTTDFMDQPFGNQMIAMYTYSSASFPYNAKAVGDNFKWAVAPVAGLAGKDSRYLMQGTNIGIFKNHPKAERDAAWKFLKFITSTSNCVLWATRTGYMPIRYSVVHEPAMQKYLEQNSRYRVASSLVLSDKGKQEPRMAVWEGVRQDIDVMVDRILNRADIDPKAELEATAKKVSEKIKARKK
jgi:multiple sugar transport system substrate-binding protein